MTSAEDKIEKILVVRFSSFGDVIQCLSVAGALKLKFPRAEIHWVTRQEFAPLIETHPAVSQVWYLHRDQGFKGLLDLAMTLRGIRFTHVYDAHNNLRSHFIGWVLKGLFSWRCWFQNLSFLRRPIYRWRRFLLFNFRKNLFPQPFNGQADLLRPLSQWGIPIVAPPAPQFFLSASQREQVLQRLDLKSERFVALAPSAAYALKRWPLSHWMRLIQICDKQRFVVLGGPADDFLADLKSKFPERVKNFAGQLSLSESAVAISAAQALVSNDTGLLHVAEQLGVPAVALMGPAPFGFPSRATTKILELPLSCRPCSKHGQGPCTNPSFHQCLVDIKPELVASTLNTTLRGSDV